MTDAEIAELRERWPRTSVRRSRQNHSRRPRSTKRAASRSNGRRRFERRAGGKSHERPRPKREDSAKQRHTARLGHNTVGLTQLMELKEAIRNA